MHRVVIRNGIEETAHFTFSFSPVPDETGAIAGMFCAVDETTAMVRRLVALHGGEASAQSAGLGQGSTFVLWLPRMKPL